MTDAYVDLAVGDGSDLGVTETDALLVSKVVNPSNIVPPSPPPYGPADYLAALQGLMPRGRVWPRGPGAVQALVLAALAMTPARLGQSAGALISGAFPSTAGEMLPEWEGALGLPDPCAGPAPTLQARQSQVVAKLINSGGQSVTFFVQLAAALGYAITITEFSGAQAHHWQVNCPQVQAIRFRAGQSTAGEPLLSGGSAVLECVINELKPAQTTVSFLYGD
ncbi:MAG TPA: putative phage tail protein [Caulobacteraceae bacterium]|jgi:uncharacterized protein YmfQ (DUF2313 family)|nr:putative phage tail protein [Caulobacteraceae bacterium]